MKKGTLILGLCIMACFFMVTASAFAAQYDCTVDRILSQQNNKVVVSVYPADGETGFTGIAHVTIDAGTPGGKVMVATLLTAVSMGGSDAVLVLTCPSAPTKTQPFQNVMAIGVYP
jgi:ABC-type uncharacterized transport system permease subunit